MKATSKNSKSPVNAVGTVTSSSGGQISTTIIQNLSAKGGQVVLEAGGLGKSSIAPSEGFGVQYPSVRESVIECDGNLKKAFKHWQRLVKQLGILDQESSQVVGLAKAFPEGQANAQKDVAAALWWWRNFDRESCQGVLNDPEGIGDGLTQFRERYEFSAWMYEYRARFDRECAWDFGHPWPCCTKLQRLFLALLWPGPKEPIAPDARFDKPWKFQLTDPILVNLRVHDSVWIDVLKKQLREMRESEGIAQPKRGGAFKRLSWLPIELLDRRFLCSENMKDSERSNLSKANKKYLLSCCKLKLQPSQRGVPRKASFRKCALASI